MSYGKRDDIRMWESKEVFGCMCHQEELNKKAVPEKDSFFAI